jgi:predicted metal-dependent hydrolase
MPGFPLARTHEGEAMSPKRRLLPDKLGPGIALFNRANFLDAHEALEDIWRAAPGPEKKFLQGLIQVAVALYHHGNGNVIGARSVLRRGFRNLSRYPEGFGGIHLAGLLNSISDWQRALDEGTPVPALPKIVVKQSSVVSRRSSGKTR